MKKETKSSIFLNSVGGVLIILLCVILFNIIMAQFKFKADLTEGDLYTLSEGSKKLLDKLDEERAGDDQASQLEIRLYITNDKGVPVFISEHGRKIEDLLDQYEAYAGSNLVLNKINPRRDTEEEDAAISDGMQLLGSPSNGFYVGMAISYLDSTETIPFLDPTPAKAATLEYDISRSIKNLLQVKSDRQTVGVMSSLNVWGGPDPSNPMAMMNRGPQQPPWIFIRQLQQDFNVERLEPAATAIPSAVDILLVIHPKNVSPATEYALDQFVLRGGKLIAFVDPLALQDTGNNQNPQMQIPGMGGASNLTRLFSKWGVPFDGTQVVSDLKFKLPQRDHMARGRNLPAFLSLGKEALNSEEIATRDLGTIRLPYAGSFDTSNVATGLKVTELITSSDQAKLVDGMSSQFNGDKIVNSFLTGGKDGKPVTSEKLTMALRLSGKFTTAFPDGKPDPEPAANGEEKTGDATHLTESENDNHVCIIGDTDILADEHFVVQQRFQISQNIPLVQNLIDFFGDSTLINIRSRNQDRPFTTIVNLKKDAREKFEEELKKLEEQQQKILQEKTRLESTGEGSNQFTLSIDPEALKEIRKNEVENNRQRREIQKSLQSEIDWIELKIKLANIGAMPLGVILFGVVFFILKRKKTAAH
tara:strand:- start:5285 stop:7222 length:1938 start_codon:yes stop_codon:yes gene_type:complete